MNFLKKIFRKRKKDVPLHETLEYDNVERFLNCSAKLNINTETVSRSTKYFKETADILEEGYPVNVDESNTDALQSTLNQEVEIEENKHLILDPEEETAIFHREGT